MRKHKKKEKRKGKERLDPGFPKRPKRKKAEVGRVREGGGGERHQTCCYLQPNESFWDPVILAVPFQLCRLEFKQFSTLLLCSTCK